jgi:hypothetical protein
VELWIQGKVAEEVRLNGSLLPLCEPPKQSAPACWVQNTDGKIVIESDPIPVTQQKTIAVITKDAVATTKGFFICENATTQVGTSLYVVGNVPALGNWNPDHGVRMDASAYPTWTKLVAGLSTNKTIEWKCVKRREGGAVRNEWQVGANNVLNGTHAEYAGPTWGRF